MIPSCLRLSTIQAADRIVVMDGGEINEDRGNANWGHHQGWEYPAHHNEEDWAAKARAWAAAKATTDYQPSQSQFAQVGRFEDQSHYNDLYAQTTDPHYPDSVQSLLPASGYQQYPPPAAPSYRPPNVQLQESASISSGLSSFVPDEHVAYTARDGILAGDSTAVFHHQESSPTSSSVHLQEVPSSYSSVTGIKEAGDQNGKFYKSFPLTTDSNQGLHQVHPPLSEVGRPVSMEQPHYAVGNQSAEASFDLSDQPLVFSHRFNHNHDQLTQPSYMHTDSGPIAATPSNHTWTSPAMPYPPIPPGLQSRQQHDSSIAVPSPVPGNSAPLFGRMPGPSFQPTIPSASASFGIGAGGGLHQTTAFPCDVYGASSVPERPKKAPVPNWLREEIIKNKAVIVNSALEHPKEETESIEDEAIDKSLRKADQADSKSIDSSKSTEEEEDDEDYVDAARTARINQEIKRILTEVLLKVTDELFDEIATKVMSEDDITVEVDQNVASNHKLSPSAPSVLTPKASAKVLLPGKAEVTENELDNGKSTSSSPGDVLGLASYASDDEDDNSAAHQQPSTRKLSEDKHAVENGRSQVETEGHSKGLRNVEGDTGKIVPSTAAIHQAAMVNESSENKIGGGSSAGNAAYRYSSKTESGADEDVDNFHDENRTENTDASRPNHSVAEKVMKTEMPLENISAKKSGTDDSQGIEARNKQDKNDVRVTKRSSSGKDIVKEVDSSKDRTDEREDDKHRRQEERHVKKERTDDRNGSKERMKEQGGKSEEKARESDSRKRSSHPDVKEDRKGKERDRRANAEEDGDRRRDRTKDEKGERSGHKLASESSRHRKRRDSSDESSDDSKRKLHSKRRNLSPSPNRSRRRQDSRSPHSKHSQRRHSPYSSLETIRGKRSRSRSPVRRQR
ncbi:uncharacterized protein LOC130781149 isoform X2 [Actinidia eriantha]|uniref:uncharacterized protein LOC130781149 isoform X2 n=2 Tax=Actinidia eriantha TaxID=165200 RepID=UPI002583662F|nr:uncharacterized protein LOC130781149 isoform X2 [Actinidia eriantha]XP_057496207.1 uncharacterized protein LOC130781149 isoform X2 [Actinidia eriantha]XP_057496209.1 uncharacterized protein LOC130781149 isoform X2 [Actinidia eriantha]